MGTIGDGVRKLPVGYHARAERAKLADQVDRLEAYVESMKGALGVWESDYASNDEDAGSSFAYQAEEHLRTLEKP